jgi:hypothetical protein
MQLTTVPVQRPRLTGTTIAERILCFLQMQPGATTSDIKVAVNLPYSPNAQLCKMKKKSLVRAEHGQVPGQKEVQARWWVVT